MVDLGAKFFTFNELTNSKSYPHIVQENRADAMQYLRSAKKLAQLLDEIREILGAKPIQVNSGFRNAKLNKAVGSKSDNSTHTKFEAVDIKPLNGLSIRDNFNKLLEAKKAGKLKNLRKVLEEGSWLHIEVISDGTYYRGFFIGHNNNTRWEQVG